MKIALFLPNVGKNSGGTETYETELVRGLMRLDTSNDYHLYFQFPSAPARIGQAAENFHYHVLGSSSQVYNISVGLSQALRKLRPDVLHATFVPPLFAPENLAYTLPCAAVFARSHYYPLSIRLRLMALCEIGVRRAQAVMCISNFISKYLTENKGLHPNQLHFTPLAADSIFRPHSSDEVNEIVQGKYGIHAPYFLYSGRWELRKNLVRLIDAFASFKKKSSYPHKLVFTGGRTWHEQEIMKRVEHHRLGDDFIDVGKSPMSDLPALYAGATALTFPSLYESFGMPILESLQCGTPVITSNFASMPEIGGKGAILVNPFEVEEITAAMMRFGDDPSLRSRLQKFGYEQAALYSWDKTAKKSLEGYERIAARIH